MQGRRLAGPDALHADAPGRGGAQWTVRRLAPGHGGSVREISAPPAHAAASRAADAGGIRAHRQITQRGRQHARLQGLNEVVPHAEVADALGHAARLERLVEVKTESEVGQRGRQDAGGKRSVEVLPHVQPLQAGRQRVRPQRLAEVEPDLDVLHRGRDGMGQQRMSEQTGQEEVLEGERQHADVQRVVEPSSQNKGGDRGRDNTCRYRLVVPPVEVEVADTTRDARGGEGLVEVSLTWLRRRPRPMRGSGDEGVESRLPLPLLHLLRLPLHRRWIPFELSQIQLLERRRQPTPTRRHIHQQLVELPIQAHAGDAGARLPTPRCSPRRQREGEHVRGEAEARQQLQAARRVESQQAGGVCVGEEAVQDVADGQEVVEWVERRGGGRGGAVSAVTAVCRFDGGVGMCCRSRVRLRSVMAWAGRVCHCV